MAMSFVAAAWGVGSRRACDDSAIHDSRNWPSKTVLMYDTENL
jgi:hypothetical protein